MDYGEWKNGIRAAGLLTAVGAAFCLKAGAGLGGAIPLWIMGNCGYVPNVEQTAASLKGIEFGFIWLPAICLGLSVIPVLFFTNNLKVLEPQIHEQLEQRREQKISRSKRRKRRRSFSMTPFSLFSPVQNHFGHLPLTNGL